MTSTLVGVVGSAGSGKSTSIFPEPLLGIVGLDPTKTFIINVSGKPFPNRGWRKKYTPFTGKEGNYLNSSEALVICKAMLYISENRPEITAIVLDDAQYLMAFEYIEKAMIKGYDKFSEIAMHIMQVLNTGRNLRPDITTIVLTHSEDVELNFESSKKIKTVGKLVDSAVDLMGMFTVLLFTKTTWSNTEHKTTYEFVTNRDGVYPAKTPYGMFADLYIPNDLAFVLKTINEYENDK